MIAVLLFAAALTPLDIVQNAVELSEKADHLRQPLYAHSGRHLAVGR